jgi:hypothetical protein
MKKREEPQFVERYLKDGRPDLFCDFSWGYLVAHREDHFWVKFCDELESGLRFWIRGSGKDPKMPK